MSNHISKSAQRWRIARNVVACMMAFVMMFYGLPAEAIAAQLHGNDKQVLTTVGADELAPEASSPAFDQSKTVDGVKVTVQADEGVFPEGSTLEVKTVSKKVEAKVAEAVDEVRDTDREVASSYTFDVKVTKDGKEIQPDGEKVRISFKTAEVAEDLLTTEVYHIADLKNPEAEALEVEEKGKVATAETDGFSTYEILFTYEGLSYTMPANQDSVTLDTIMDAVGLAGRIYTVKSEPEGAITATGESRTLPSEWTITPNFDDSVTSAVMNVQLADRPSYLITVYKSDVEQPHKMYLRHMDGNIVDASNPPRASELLEMYVTGYTEQQRREDLVYWVTVYKDGSVADQGFFTFYNKRDETTNNDAHMPPSLNWDGSFNTATKGYTPTTVSAPFFSFRARGGSSSNTGGTLDIYITAREMKNTDHVVAQIPRTVYKFLSNGEATSNGQSVSNLQADLNDAQRSLRPVILKSGDTEKLKDVLGEAGIVHLKNCSVTGTGDTGAPKLSVTSGTPQYVNYNESSDVLSRKSTYTDDAYEKITFTLNKNGCGWHYGLSGSISFDVYVLGLPTAHLEDNTITISNPNPWCSYKIVNANDEDDVFGTYYPTLTDPDAEDSAKTIDPDHQTIVVDGLTKGTYKIVEICDINFAKNQGKTTNQAVMIDNQNSFTINHVHTWGYTLKSNNTITATCVGTTGDPACNPAAKHDLTLRADNTTYGSAPVVYLDGLDAFNTATGKTVTSSDIKYYAEADQTQDLGREHLDTLSAGKYVAKITVGEVTAWCGFTVAKVDNPNETGIKESGKLTGVSGLKYDGSAKELITAAPTQPDDYSGVSYECSTDGGNNWDAATLSESGLPVGTAVGTYKIRATYTDHAYYKDITTDPVEVTIGKGVITPTVTINGWTYGETASTPSVDGNTGDDGTGDGDVTYQYYEKDGENYTPLNAAPTDAGSYAVKATVAECDNYLGAETARVDFAIAKASTAIDAANKTVTYEAAGISIPVDGMFTIPAGAGAPAYAVAPAAGEGAGEGTFGDGKLTVTKAGKFTVTVTTAESDTNKEGSASATLTVAKAAGPEPSGSESAGFAQDYPNETYSISEGYEVRNANNDSAAEIPTTAGSLTSIIDSNRKVYIRLVETAVTFASGWVEVELAERPAAPDGLGSTPASNATAVDGAITGTTTAMEYKLKNTGDWLSGWTDAGASSTAVAAGTYLVRYKATGSAYASQVAEVTVGSSYVALDDSISVAINKGGSPIGNTAPVVGDSLTASCNASDITYQWYRGDEPISGATSATYTVTADDFDKPLKVVATQTKDASGNDHAADAAPKANSDFTEKVVKKENTNAKPTVTASKTDTTITVTGPAQENLGTDAVPVYKYEYSVDNGATWQDGATFENLTPATAYQVVAREKATADTAAGTKSDALEVTTDQKYLAGVSISGTLKDGQEITANCTPTDAGTPISYQWYSAETADGSFTEIQGATGAAYTVKPGDVGKYLKVVATQTSTSKTASAVTTAAITGESRTVTVPENIPGGTVTIDPAAPTIPVTGQLVTVTTTPDSGWRTIDVTVSKTDDPTTSFKATKDGSNDNVFTYTQPGYDVTVTPAFEKIEYTIAAPTAAQNGTVALAGVTKADNDSKSNETDTASIDDTVKLTATPADGYALATLTVTTDGAQGATIVPTKQADGSYAFAMPAGNVTGIQATFTQLTAGQKPSAATNLSYTGSAQDLVNAPTGDLPTGYTGYMYSLKNPASEGFDPTKDWSPTVPAGTDAGAYTVYAKLVGDDNHQDVMFAPMSPTIAKADLANTAVTLDPASGVAYDAQDKAPAPTVKLSDSVVVDAQNYDVAYYKASDVNADGSLKAGATAVTPKEAGDYKVIITAKDSSANYQGKKVVDFTIAQATLGKDSVTGDDNAGKRPTAKGGLVYTGSEQDLVDGPAAATIDAAGKYHIEYKQANGSWGTAVPKATDANESGYEVVYRYASTDANYAPLEDESFKLTVPIAKANLANTTVTLDPASGVAYDSNDKAAVPTVKLGDSVVVDAQNYDVAYYKASDVNADGSLKAGATAVTPKEASDYKVVITAKDSSANYQGKKVVDFTIAKSTPTQAPTVEDGAVKADKTSITIDPTVAGYEYLVTTNAAAPTGDWSQLEGTPYYKEERTGDKLSYTFENLNEGTQYYVHVRKAETANDQPSPATTKSAPTAPAAPVVDAVTSNSITLKDAVKGVTYVLTKEGADPVEVTAGDTGTVAFTNLDEATGYKVTAYVKGDAQSGVKDSPASATDPEVTYTLPSTPATPQATPTSSTSIELANPQNGTEYTLAYKDGDDDKAVKVVPDGAGYKVTDADGQPIQGATATMNGGKLVLDGLQPATTYSLTAQVPANSPVSASEPSQSVTVTTLQSAPAALTVTPVTVTDPKATTASVKVEPASADEAFTITDSKGAAITVAPDGNGGYTAKDKDGQPVQGVTAELKDGKLTIDGLAPNTTYDVVGQIPASATEPASDPTAAVRMSTAKVPAEAPSNLVGVRTTGADKSDGKITGVDATMEWWDGETTEGGKPVWTKVTSAQATAGAIEGLPAGDKYQVRVAETDTRAASAPATVTVPGKEPQAAPADTPVLKEKTSKSITITANEDGKHQYSIDGVNWVDADKDGNVVFTKDGDGADLQPATEYTVYTRLAADETHDPSPAGGNPLKVTTKGTQDAPSNLTADKATGDTAADGAIHGVTAAMEYFADNEWKPVPQNATSLTGLPKGTYQVRYAATAELDPSPATSIEVGVKTTPAGAPATTGTKTNSQTDDKGKTSITVDPTKPGYEYVVTESPNGPSDADWAAAAATAGAVNSTYYKENGAQDGTHTFTGLDSSKTYYVHVRTAETPDANPSPSTVLPVNPAPKPGEGYSIDNPTETITVEEGYEIKAVDPQGTQPTDWTSGKTVITVTPGAQYEIRKKGDDTAQPKIPASDATLFTAPERGDTPKDFAATADDSVPGSDTVSITISPVEDGVAYTVKDADSGEVVKVYTPDPQNPGSYKVTDKDGKPVEPATAQAQDGKLVVDGLEPAHAYTVVAQRPANDDKLASEAKGVNVTTEKATIDPSKLDADNKAEAASGLTYNGAAQDLVKAPKEAPAGYTMKYSTDGSTWSENVPTGTDAGKYTVYVKYEGDAQHEDATVGPLTVNIAKAEITADDVDLASTSFIYSGKAQGPVVTVKVDGNVLAAGTDYEIAGATGTDAGAYELTITAKDSKNYFIADPGAITKAFEITAYPADGKVEVSFAGDASFTYNGKDQRPAETDVTVKVNETTLVAGTDYDLVYSAKPGQSVDVGGYEVKAVLKGNYSGETAKDYAIVQATDFEVSAAPTEFTYSGKPQGPVVTVKANGTVLTEGVDYTLSGATATDKGDYTLTVAGKGNFKGSKTATYKIKPYAKGEGDKVAVSFGEGEDSFTYTGSDQRPAADKVKVAFNGAELAAGTDYDLVYVDADGNTLAADGSVDAGSYAVKVVLKGNYEGQSAKGYKIEPQAIAVAFAGSEFAWTGKAQGPTYEVKGAVDGKAIAEGGYSVAGTPQAEVGEYVATITGKGNYTGTATQKFQIAKAAQQAPSLDGVTVATKNDDAGNPVITVNPSDAGQEYVVVPANATAGDIAQAFEDNAVPGNGGELAIGTDATTGKPLQPAVEYKVVTRAKGDGSHEPSGPTPSGPLYTKPAAPAKPAVAANDAEPGSETVSISVKPVADDAVYTVKDADGNVVKVLTPDPDKPGSFNVTDKDGKPAEPATAAKQGSGDKATLVVDGLQPNKGYTVEAQVPAKGEVPASDTVKSEPVTTKKAALTESSLTDDQKVKANTGLTYNGKDQQLVSAPKEVPAGYTMMYAESAEGPWSENVPTGTDAKDGYKVYVKYAGDAAHEDLVLADPFTVGIAKKQIADGDVVLASDAFTFSGKEQGPAVTVTVDGKILASPADYSISGATATNAGDYTVTVEGTGNYTGKVQKSYSITAAQAGDKVEVAFGNGEDSFTYNGKDQRPNAENVVVKLDGKELVQGTDYDLVYSAAPGESVDAGGYEVKVVLKGDYAGEAVKDYEITTADAANFTIDAKPTELTYSGKAQGPAVTVRSGNTVLTEDVDYTLAGATATAKGEYTLTVTGKGNYSGQKAQGYKINAYPVNENSRLEVRLPDGQDAFGYDGTPKAPSADGIEVWLDGKKLGKDDYTLDIPANAVNAGSYEVKVTLSNNFGNATTAKGYKITPQAIKVTFEGAEFAWTGKAQGPKITVTGSNDQALSTPADYTVLVGTAVEVGEYTATVEGTGNYTGKQTHSYKIAKAAQQAPSLDGVTIATKNDDAGNPVITVNPSDAGQEYVVVPANATADDIAQAFEDNAVPGNGGELAIGTDATTGQPLQPAAEYKVVTRAKGDGSHKPSNPTPSDPLYTKPVAPAAPVVEAVKGTPGSETASISIKPVADNAVYTVKDADGNVVKVLTPDPAKPGSFKVADKDGKPAAPATAAKQGEGDKATLVVDGLQPNKGYTVEAQVPVKGKVPASDTVTSKKVTTAKAEPAAELPPVDTGKKTVKVEEPVAGQEYILLPKGQQPTEADWAKAKVSESGEDIVFGGLRAGSDYTLYTRVPADETHQASAPVAEDVSTAAGSLTTEVDVEEGAPKTKVAGLTKKAAADIVGAGAMAAIDEDGDDVKVFIDVKSIDGHVPAKDSKLLKAAAKKAAGKASGQAKVGTCFDVSLFKQVNGGQPVQLAGTKGHKVKLTFDVPRRLWKAGRTFYLVHAHGKSAKVVDATTGHRLTAEVTDFSTYAIAYSDPSQKAKFALDGGLKVSQTGKTVNVAWGKVEGVDGYDVYVNYCGDDFSKKPARTVKSAEVTSVKVKRVEGKKLNLKKNYKVCVRAFKVIGGKKIVVCSSIVAHIVGKKNTRYTNVKDIVVARTSATLAKGGSLKVRAKVKLVDPKRKQLNDEHAPELRFRSTDRKVAKVDGSGKVTAVGKGSCTVYVYAKNGHAKAVKVTVR